MASLGLVPLKHFESEVADATPANGATTGIAGFSDYRQGSRQLKKGLNNGWDHSSIPNKQCIAK